jgi:hypothetical protein
MPDRRCEGPCGPARLGLAVVQIDRSVVAPVVGDRARGNHADDSAASAEEPTVRARLDVPARTIAKIALAIVVLWLLVRISTILIEVFCALLLTAALDPVVTRLERRG